MEHRYIYEDERSPHLEFTDKRRSAARMFASRGERQGSPFLRETVASLTAERRGRNWPRVGERPQASATFSFLQPSRWPIHFTYRCLSFPLSLSRTVLLLLLGRSSPAPASPPRLSSAPPPDYMPPLLPPLVDTDRPSLLLALFTPLLSALVFAPRDVGGIQHAIQNAFTGKKKGNPGQLRRKIATIFSDLFFPRDICENNLFCSSSSTS